MEIGNLKMEIGNLKIEIGNVKHGNWKMESGKMKNGKVQLVYNFNAHVFFSPAAFPKQSRCQFHSTKGSCGQPTLPQSSNLIQEKLGNEKKCPNHFLKKCSNHFLNKI